MSPTDLSGGIIRTDIVTRIAAGTGISINDTVGPVTITNTGGNGGVPVSNTYGSFVMDTSTSQQYAYTISPNSITYIKMQWLDLASVTVPVTLRVYAKVNASDWREMGAMQLGWNPDSSNAGDAIALKEMALGIDVDIRLSIQNSVGTDSSNTIYYRYISEYHS